MYIAIAGLPIYAYCFTLIEKNLSMRTLLLSDYGLVVVCYFYYFNLKVSFWTG